MPKAFQHDKTAGHDEWLTPPDIIQALAPFDLDPCAPIIRPWDTAKQHFTVLEDGLSQEWGGHNFVWLNPPYGKETGRWIQKLARHNNGIALIFARTDTKTWQQDIFPKATAILFLAGRLTFYTVKGVKGKDTAGAPSALIAYGKQAGERLEKYATQKGNKDAYIRLQKP